MNKHKFTYFTIISYFFIGTILSQTKIQNIRDSIHRYAYSDLGKTKLYSARLFQLGEQLNDNSIKIEALHSKCYLLNTENKLLQLKSTIDSCQAIFDKSESQWPNYHKARYDHLLISALFKATKLGQYPIALEELLEAEKTLSKHSEEFENIFYTQYILHYWLSSIYKYQYKYHEAILHMHKSMQSYISSKEIEDIMAVNDLLQEYQSLAILEKYVGNDSMYQEYMEVADLKAHRLLEKNPDHTIYRSMVRNCYGNQFELWIDQNELKKAEIYLNKIHALLEPKSDSVNYFIKKSKLESAKGHFDLAKKILDDELKKASQISKFSEMNTRSLLLKHHIESRQFNEAYDHLDYIVSTVINRQVTVENLKLRNIIFDQKLLEVLELASHLFIKAIKQNKLPTSQSLIIAYAQFSFDYISQKRMGFNSYTDLLNGSNTFRSILNNYIILFAILNESKSLSQTIDFAKSFSLEFSRLKNQQIQSNDNDSLKVLESQLKTKIIDLEQDLLSGKNNNLQSIDSLLTLKKKYSNLQDKIINLSTFKGQLDYNNLEIPLNKNQSILNYYFSDSLLVIVHNHDQITEFIVQENIDSLPVFLNRDLNNIQTKNALQYQAQISNLILPEKLNLKEYVIIIPHAILYYFPFEVLKYKDQPLLKDHNISYANSRMLLNQDASLNLPKFLGVAPNFDKDCGDFSPLKFSENEINSIGKYFNKPILISEDSTPIQTFKLNLTKSNIIHLATHAQIDEENSFNSFIAFGESCEGSLNNKLFLKDILGINLNADLLVLSACNSGIGELITGEGLTSFSKTFFHSNVKSVVSTLWTANDQTTSEIIILFYDFLSKGMKKDEALRNAKLEYIENADPDYQHPYYWAGIIAMGDMSPLFPNPRKKYYWLLGGFIIVFGIGYFLKTRNRNSIAA